MSLEWPNAETGYRIVSCAERSFFEGRRAAEVAVIADTIDILKAEAERQREAVDAAFAHVVDLRPRRSTSRRPGARRRPALVRADGDRHGARPLAARGAPRSRRASTRSGARSAPSRSPGSSASRSSRAELDRLRLTYAAAHPAGAPGGGRPRAARVEPQDLVELRQEEHDLVARLGDFARPRPPRRARRRRRARRVAGAAVVVDASPREDEPELATAKTKLTAATRKYEDLMDRVDSARIELHTAQAAFKYRYTVVDPPEIPKEAKRPNRALLVVGGVVLGVLLAFFAAGAKDLLSGVFIERWQVRRRLALPVLAELEGP